MSNKARGKLTPSVFEQAKHFMENHTVAEAALRFGTSKSTMGWVSRYDSFKAMKQEKNRVHREYMRSRGVKLRNLKADTVDDSNSPVMARAEAPIPDAGVYGSPFQKNVKPKPMVGANLEKAPTDADGPVKRTVPKKIEGQDIVFWYNKYLTFKKQCAELINENRSLKENNEKGYQALTALQKSHEELQHKCTGCDKTQTAAEDDMVVVTVGHTRVSVMKI